MPKVVCLSVVRHGQCISNVDPARKDDNFDPLTSRGQAQVRALGDSWANVRIDALYSSPLDRARDTAKAIAERNQGHPEVQLDDNLVERRYGEYLVRLARRGCDSRRFFEVLNGGWSGALADTNRDYHPPEGGESLAEVAARALIILMKVLSHAVERNEAFEPPLSSNGYHIETCKPTDVPDGIPHVVLVSHNIFLSELYELIQGWNSNDHVWTRYTLKNVDWTRCVLSWEDDKRDVDEGHAKDLGPLQSVTLNEFKDDYY